MRVVSGIAKGIPLKAPKGDLVRPTVDRLKETLFNMIQHEVYDAVVLDLFAGSGGLGIEALSRGASETYFCEKNQAAFEIMKENLNKTKLMNHAKLYFGDFIVALPKMAIQKVRFDLVFLDPPYEKAEFYQKSIEFLVEKDMLSDDALIIAETISGLDFSFLEKYDTIWIEKSKIFKTNQYIFMRYGNGA